MHTSDPSVHNVCIWQDNYFPVINSQRIHRKTVTVIWTFLFEIKLLTFIDLKNE